MGSSLCPDTAAPFDLGRPLPFSVVTMRDLDLIVQVLPFPHLSPRTVFESFGILRGSSRTPVWDGASAPLPEGDRLVPSPLHGGGPPPALEHRTADPVHRGGGLDLPPTLPACAVSPGGANALSHSLVWVPGFPAALSLPLLWVGKQDSHCGCLALVVTLPFSSWAL